MLSRAEGDKKNWKQEDKQKRWRSRKRALDGTFHMNMILQSGELRARRMWGNGKDLSVAAVVDISRQKHDQGQKARATSKAGAEPDHPRGTWASLCRVQRMSAAT